MFRNHTQFGDSKAVIGRRGTRGHTFFLPCDFHVVAHMGFEINTAGGDLENLPRAVFCKRVGTIGSAQTTTDIHHVGVAACVRSLGKSQGHEQGRYNYQQKYIFHGNPPKILALRRSEGFTWDLSLLWVLTQNACALRTG
jgi:hypothetical protein